MLTKFWEGFGEAKEGVLQYCGAGDSVESLPPPGLEGVEGLLWRPLRGRLQEEGPQQERWPGGGTQPPRAWQGWDWAVRALSSLPSQPLSPAGSCHQPTSHCGQAREPHHSVRKIQPPKAKGRMGNGGETSRKYPEGVLEQISCCHLLTNLPKGHAEIWLHGVQREKRCGWERERLWGVYVGVEQSSEQGGEGSP